MPELPEVETIARRLAEILPGKKIVSVEIAKDKSFGGNPKDAIGQEITAVTRKSKVLRFHLPNEMSILTHLKMTGQLIYVDDHRRVGGGHPSADFVAALPGRHTRIIYTFADQSQLFFNDQRMFGWMRLLPDKKVAEEFALFGPDATDELITVEYLAEKFKNRSIPIKQAIMMNDIIAGVGNIYACDSLNVAQLSPFKPAKNVTKEELNRLLIAIQAVLAEGIRLGGTTFDGKYVNVDGLTGSYQDKIKVYGRQGQKCYQCGGTIVKTTLGGRGTYYCERCQG